MVADVSNLQGEVFRESLLDPQRPCADVRSAQIWRHAEHSARTRVRAAAGVRLAVAAFDRERAGGEDGCVGPGVLPALCDTRARWAGEGNGDVAGTRYWCTVGAAEIGSCGIGAQPKRVANSQEY